MITMDVKGITWVGNIYQKFENMCLEAEDMICEDAVKYIENQMQTVGASVKKLYSDVMQDFIPPSSCDLDEMAASEPVDQYTDAGFFEKPFQGFKEKPVKEDTKQTNNDSRIDHDVDNEAIHAASNDGTSRTDALFMSSSRNSVKGRNFISHSRHYVGTMDIKPNLGIDENQVTKRVAATKKFDEITLAETDAYRTSQSCELSNENQNHTVCDSKPASSEVTRRASLADCCNEIENASTEQFPNVPVFAKSAEEKQMNTSSSSDVLFGASDGFSLDRRIQSDDCSYSMVVISHPEIPSPWSLGLTKTYTAIEQGHKTMQQDHLKLEETCVMVTGDELKLVPKAGGNVKTNKKKRRQAFSLSKKSARRQEYEELAVWHGNSEKLRGRCVENLDPTSLEDQKKLMLPSMSDPEWELL